MGARPLLPHAHRAGTKPRRPQHVQLGFISSSSAQMFGIPLAPARLASPPHPQILPLEAQHLRSWANTTHCSRSPTATKWCLWVLRVAPQLSPPTKVVPTWLCTSSRRAGEHWKNLLHHLWFHVWALLRFEIRGSGKCLSMLRSAFVVLFPTRHNTRSEISLQCGMDGPRICLRWCQSTKRIIICHHFVSLLIDLIPSYFRQLSLSAYSSSC